MMTRHHGLQVGLSLTKGRVSPTLSAPMPSLVTDQLGDILTNADRCRTLGEKFFGGCLEERRKEFTEECRRD
eukprot:12454545-Alexandrium_andersonii.AAC.1